MTSSTTLPCLDAATQPEIRECPPPAQDLDVLRRQLASIERRIDVLQRNRQAIKKYLNAWTEAGATA